MKKFNSILLPYICILFFFILGTQYSSAQTLMDRLADETCEEMNKLDDNLSPAEVEKEMEEIMGKVLIANYANLEKEYGITLEGIETEDKAFNDFSEKFAMKLFGMCPKFMEIIILISDEEDFEDDDSSAKSDTIEGKFIGFEGKDFTYVKIEQGNGRVKKLFWGEPFDGDNLLMNTKKLKGKEISVSYTEKECYNAKLKDYNNIKVITAMELK